MVGVRPGLTNERSRFSLGRRYVRAVRVFAIGPLKPDIPGLYYDFRNANAIRLYLEPRAEGAKARVHDVTKMSLIFATTLSIPLLSRCSAAVIPLFSPAPFSEKHENFQPGRSHCAGESCGNSGPKGCEAGRSPYTPPPSAARPGALSR